MESLHIATRRELYARLTIREHTEWMAFHKARMTLEKMARDRAASQG